MSDVGSLGADDGGRGLWWVAGADGWRWRSSAALLVSLLDDPSGTYTRDRSHRGNSVMRQLSLALAPMPRKRDDLYESARSSYLARVAAARLTRGALLLVPNRRRADACSSHEAGAFPGAGVARSRVPLSDAGSHEAARADTCANTNARLDRSDGDEPACRQLEVAAVASPRLAAGCAVSDLAPDMGDDARH